MEQQKMRWLDGITDLVDRFFLELSCFFDDPMDVGNLISGSSAFFLFFLNFKYEFIETYRKASKEKT